MNEHLFFIGKGGVGKSTVSALTAIKLSLSNKILLVSLDPAHNLSDIFSLSFSDKPKEAAPNLFVIEVDIKKRIKQYLQNIENDLIKSNTSLSAFNLLNEFEIIKNSPGIEEYGILMAYQEISKKYSDFDYIIFDTPPTALSIKLFSLPSISLVWINKLIDLRERIKEKKEIVSRIKIGHKELEKDKILEKLLQKKNEYQSVVEILTDKNKTRINLVVNQDILSVNEGKRIISELSALGLSVYKVVINKFEKNIEPNNEFGGYKKETIPISGNNLTGLENLIKIVRFQSLKLNLSLCLISLWERTRITFYFKLINNFYFSNHFSVVFWV